MNRISFVLFLAASLPAFSAALDLSRAGIVIPAGVTGPERKAVTMLVEEVEKRSNIRWPVRESRSQAGTPCVEVNVSKDKGRAPEGYRIETVAGTSGCAVTITGNDSRGVLFGAGRLLRALRMSRERVLLPEPLRVTSAPKFPIRGHQLGYRSGNNTYDAWTVAMYEQYIRDLVAFGSNAIEMTAPGSSIDASPHFRMPPVRMVEEVSRLCLEYGLDLSIWYPADEKDYSDPATVERAVQSWEHLFARLPKLDAVFVPGGDPGHTRPKLLMPFLEKAAAALRRQHPKAQMWVSPQGLDDEWLEELYGILRTKPAWLTGIVHGPWVRVTTEQLRAAVPAQYPIRLYPDISHTMRCQYPMRDWDRAYALTYVREPIAPRPRAETGIFHAHEQSSVGFVTYSDGCNDDVNKIIWTALGWDPNANVADVLREYGRYLVGVETFGDGLLSLERNWEGPLAANAGVETTLLQFQSMERTAAPAMLLNWRFQQGLYRAYYDAYTRSRLLYESALEERAMEQLRNAPQVGSSAALSSAEDILMQAVTTRVAQDRRVRVRELAEALFQSIGMQLSVEKYKGSGWERGVTLDTLDEPLNDRRWLVEQFTEIRKLADEQDRLTRIVSLLDRTNPGPGGFYDDVGNPNQEPHVLKYDDISLQGFAIAKDGPLAWFDHATSWRDRPVRMRYTGLDPAAAYKVRVVYAGEAVNQEQGIRLLANDEIVVHPYVKKPLPVRPVEFDIPAEATRSGTLTLSWDREAPPSGRIRGAQVSEVWLIRK
ncbi:MAG: hypothetical protein ABFD60_17165 [Bryobacteraceae bacterium]